MDPFHHGLMVATGGAAYLGGIFALADLVERHKPLSGARMGRIHCLGTKVIRFLLPAIDIYSQHETAERDWQLIYSKSQTIQNSRSQDGRGLYVKN